MAVKSRTVHRWMLGVSHHGSGSEPVIGMRPLQQQVDPDPPVAEVGQGDDRPVGDPQQLAQHMARPLHRLQRLRQDHVIEGPGREVIKIAIGVALHHRQPPGQTGRHPFGADLQAASVNLILAHQQFEEFTLPAAHVEHPRTWGHQAQDLVEAVSRTARLKCVRRLSARAPAPRNT